MMKRLIYLLIAAALSGAPAFAQPGFIELQPVYGMTQANASQTLTQAGLTDQQAKDKFPKYWARWVFEGRTIQKFMLQNFGVCAAQDAFWVGHVHAFTSIPFPAGSGNIQFGPVSPMMVNNSMWWPYGRVEGVGCFGDPRYNTVLKLSDAQSWQGDPANRHILVSPGFGRQGAQSYHESAKLNHIRLEGNKAGIWSDPSFLSCGLIAWDMGEGSHVYDVMANWFDDYGVMIVRGTPAHFDNISGFHNGRAAVGMIGCAKSNVTIGVLSGDENPWLIEMLPGYGREAGCASLKVINAKLETSTTGEGDMGLLHVWKGQGAAYLSGQFNVEMGLTYASPWIKTGQLFFVDDRLLDGTPQASRLEVTGNGFGFGALLIDGRRDVWYKAPQDDTDWHMVYTTSDGVLTLNGVVQVPQPYPANAGPMGFARVGQTLNYATGTPQKQITGTTPPPPTPVTCTGWTAGTWSTWSACVTGSQARTRTVTATPTGCTTTPPGAKPADTETQSCTVTPPPTGSVIATLNNVSVSTVSTSTPVNWPNAKSIDFTGLKATGSLGGHLCVAAGRGLKVGTDGSVYISVTGVGNVQCVPPIPAGTVKLNTAVTFTANFPDPITFTRLGTILGTGAGQAFTCTKMVVKK